MKRRSTQIAERGELVAPVTKAEHIQGNPKAPVTLLEYGDYECPYCGAAHRLVKMLREAMGADLCYVYRNFPLTEVHPRAEHAAEAVEAADAQGRLWEMHDAVFENQDALEDDDLAAYAADIGLDANRVVAEIEMEKYRSRIEKDVQSGMQSGVEGTPTFFINRVKYEGPMDPESMLTALQEAREGR
jgi:protein-disulfide isomerase